MSDTNNNPCPISETSCLDCHFREDRSCRYATLAEKKPRKWDSEEMIRIKLLEDKVADLFERIDFYRDEFRQLEQQLRQRVERIDGEKGRGL